jgi:hypothetical protein
MKPTVQGQNMLFDWNTYCVFCFPRDPQFMVLNLEVDPERTGRRGGGAWRMLLPSFGHVAFPTARASRCGSARAPLHVIAPPRTPRPNTAYIYFNYALYLALDPWSLHIFHPTTVPVHHTLVPVFTSFPFNADPHLYVLTRKSTNSSTSVSHHTSSVLDEGCKYNFPLS